MVYFWKFRKFYGELFITNNSIEMILYLVIVSYIVDSSGCRKFLLGYVNKSDSSLFLFFISKKSGGSSFIGAIDDEKTTFGHEFRSANLR